MFSKMKTANASFVIVSLLWIIWLISIPIILALIKIEKSTKIVLFIAYIIIAICIFTIIAFLEKRILEKEKVVADEKRRIEEEQRKAEEFAAQRAREERERKILSSPIRNLTPLQFEEFTALYFKKTDIQILISRLKVVTLELIF